MYDGTIESANYFQWLVSNTKLYPNAILQYDLQTHTLRPVNRSYSKLILTVNGWYMFDLRKKLLYTNRTDNDALHDIFKDKNKYNIVELEFTDVNEIEDMKDYQVIKNYMTMFFL